MTSPVQAVTQPAAPAATAPSAANALTAGAVASSNGTGFTTSTTINSLADLKKKAPTVYNSMMQSIGMQICNEMKAHQERLKSMMRKASSNR